MPIDSPIEKIREIIDEPDDTLLSGLIQAGSAFEPLAAVIAAVKGVLDNQERYGRVRAALRALCGELERLSEALPVDSASALNSDWFRKAIQTMLEEASRATSEARAARIAIAVAHGCFPDDENKHRQADLASYVRDLAQLGVDDVQMLKLLRDAYKAPIKMTPNMHDPNYFTEKFDQFKKMAAELKIHPDDCISLGARLSGFGLAYETARNGSRQSPGEHCFRPTRRGVYLLTLLEASEAPRDQQN